MKVFLDTEFTNFPDDECDLISIGLVDENGRTFYAELTDYRQEACTDFVRQIVLPLLGKHKDTVKGNKMQVAKELAEWLEPYKDSCVICFDYQTDWILMRDMLCWLPDDMLPNFLTTKLIWGDIDKMALDYFWLEHDAFDWKPHMALWDAMANRYAYRGT
jgi:hypothetical protein